MTDNIGMTRPRIRVAAYVIRHRVVPELLTFDHIGMPEAGTQVPAGGVNLGEELEEAVLREVTEETGLQTATVLRQIAVEDKPHPDTGQPRRTSFFYLQVPADTPNAWEHHVHGDGDDAGLIFACRFLPLPLKQPLADGQEAWLGRIDPRWTTVTGDSQKSVAEHARRIRDTSTCELTSLNPHLRGGPGMGGRAARVGRVGDPFRSA